MALALAFPYMRALVSLSALAAVARGRTFAPVAAAPAASIRVKPTSCFFEDGRIDFETLRETFADESAFGGGARVHPQGMGSIPNKPDGQCFRARYQILDEENLGSGASGEVVAAHMAYDPQRPPRHGGPERMPVVLKKIK